MERFRNFFTAYFPEPGDCFCSESFFLYSPPERKNWMETSIQLISVQSSENTFKRIRLMIKKLLQFQFPPKFSGSWVFTLVTTNLVKREENHRRGKKMFQILTWFRLVPKGNPYFKNERKEVQRFLQFPMYHVEQDKKVWFWNVDV